MTGAVSIYLELTNEMKTIYGLKTIVFMQIGGFFECYDINENSRHCKIFCRMSS